jgi:hypothetical protein
LNPVPGYRFTVEGMDIVACTLPSEGDDRQRRVAEWRAVLAGATGREETDEGVAVTFDHDAARTVELARLLAAEHDCCSFASYHLTIDGHGVRVEIRTPPEARGVLAGLLDPVA